MSKDLKRKSKAPGMDDNKVDALKKMREARLNGISRVQQTKDEIQIDDGGMTAENFLDEKLDDDFIEDDGNDHGYVFEEDDNDLDDEKNEPQKKKPKLQNSILSLFPNMQNQKKTDFLPTKQNKEMKKKADDLMSNLFTQFDDDFNRDEIKQRPKLNEILNMQISTEKSQKFLYNKEENLKGNIYFNNNLQLNPLIAPNILKKLDIKNNSNSQNQTENKSKQITDDFYMEELNCIPMDIDEEDNQINFKDKNSSVQNKIENNNQNILCGREKKVSSTNNTTIINPTPSKRSRTDLEEDLKTGNKNINQNILSGRTNISNTKPMNIDDTRIDSNQNNNFHENTTNNLITPIKQLNFNDNNSNNKTLSHNSNISHRNDITEPLPLNPDGSIFVYWFDMIEESIKSNNYVIIFGKIYEPKNCQFKSISLVLKNINRTIYIIPKEDKSTGLRYDLKTVYNEFEELRKNKFSFISKIKKKETKKKYCFELPIEHDEYDVLEIKYNSNMGVIPVNLPAKTFDYIFGRQSALLENILLEKKIRGPSWLKIEKEGISENKNYHYTWCKYEIEIEDYPKNLNNFVWTNPNNSENNPTSTQIFYNTPEFNYLKSTPPLSIMSISTKTIFLNNNQEIYSICGTFIEKYYLEDEKGENEKQINIPIITVRKVDNPHVKLEDLEKIKNYPQFRGSIFIICHNEIAVINQFINKIAQFDPDIIVGHKLFTEHLDLLINRISKLKASNWSRIGRMKRETLPKFLQTSNVANLLVRNCTIGRLICDTMISCKDILKENNYDLGYLSHKILNQNLVILDPNKVFSNELNNFENNNSSALENLENRQQNKLELIKDLIFGIFKESILSYFLMNTLSILSLTKELTCIGGNLWIKSLQNSRADRCEMLLMHEFHKNNYIIPDKLNKYEKEELEDNDETLQFGSNTTNKRKPQYSGGLVLEPIADLYDSIVLLLDFNSLYPSIIQEYNICFTTVVRKSTQQYNYREEKDFNKKLKKNAEKKTKIENDEENAEDIQNLENIDENADINDFNLNIIKKTNDKAILPGILESLVLKRKVIKDLMKTEKDKFKKDLLEIKQKAVKLSANSLYGYLGYKNSRFYAKAIAALITSTGRNILQNTVKLVESKFNLQVIYGDTDSIMINTLCYDILQAMEMGNNIKKSVNQKYRLLEMEMDGIFKTLLLLKKKKYASLKFEAPFGVNSKLVKEYKGLDLVRRDWCELSKQVGIYILDIILSNKSKDDISSMILDFLKQIGEQMDKEIGSQDGYSYSDFEITKQITKNVEDYGDAKNLPHVKVAKRLREKGDLSIKMNVFIRYIVCLEKPQEIEGENNIKPHSSGSKGLADRCFHVTEIKENPNLKVDIEWYKNNQIIASVGRLCKHISQLDMHQLASCIGLDSTKYNSYLSSKKKNDEIEIININSQNDDKTNQKKIPKLNSKIGLKIKCTHCKVERELKQTYFEHDNIQELYCCPKCTTVSKNYANVFNKILLQNKRNMNNYFKGVKECMKCNMNTRCSENSCVNGIFKKKITESDAANEFNFLNGLVNCNQKIENVSNNKNFELINKNSNLQNYFNMIDYNNLDLSKTFQMFSINN